MGTFTGTSGISISRVFGVDTGGCDAWRVEAFKDYEALCRFIIGRQQGLATTATWEVVSAMLLPGDCGDDDVGARTLQATILLELCQAFRPACPHFEPNHHHATSPSTATLELPAQHLRQFRKHRAALVNKFPAAFSDAARCSPPLSLMNSSSHFSLRTHFACPLELQIHIGEAPETCLVRILPMQ